MKANKLQYANENVRQTKLTWNRLIQLQEAFDKWQSDHTRVAFMIKFHKFLIGHPLTVDFISQPPKLYFLLQTPVLLQISLPHVLWMHRTMKIKLFYLLWGMRCFAITFWTNNHAITRFNINMIFVKKSINIWQQWSSPNVTWSNWHILKTVICNALVSNGEAYDQLSQLDF